MLPSRLGMQSQKCKVHKHKSGTDRMQVSRVDVVLVRIVKASRSDGASLIIQVQHLHSQKHTLVMDYLNITHTPT